MCADHSIEPLEQRVMMSAAPAAIVALPRLGHAALGALLARSPSVSISQILPIAPRIQWDDNDGYCGETSVQTCALYYGTYISQYQARAMINRDQMHEVIVDQTAETVLNNLRLTWQQFDYSNIAAPQYKTFLGWAKRQIEAGHPVIAAVFVSGGTDPDYDHVVPFTGFLSSHDAVNYYRDDRLIFADNYSHRSFTRYFSSLPATRSIANAGDEDYYLPMVYDYGISVNGIADARRETLPVRLSIDRQDEPDIAAGESPVTLNAVATITHLVPGKTYALLRYDDFRKVPTSAFISRGGYTSIRKFVASSSTQTLSDTFMSNACVVYRCVASR